MNMKFILFMVAFALLLTFILWLIFRSEKPKPVKKTKKLAKKTSPRKNSPPKTTSPVKTNNPIDFEAEIPDEEMMKKVATELLKKNPEIVSYVVKQWLREK
ncbi:MAG: hypothetical protein HOF21_00695 [Nitrospina sp.]|jgi:flagellar biosynthesis/type III secretory pathway M-ring protein FliF/YscJ|nr:hypothetical protein [Nitrospina sp.]